MPNKNLKNIENLLKLNCKQQVILPECKHVLLHYCDISLKIFKHTYKINVKRLGCNDIITIILYLH